MKFDRSICWIRRDLRLSDHRALYEACQASKEVAVVFVFDTNILSKLNKRDRRVVFIHKALAELADDFDKLKTKLIVLQGDPCIEIPSLHKKLQSQAVFCNEDYETYAKTRDKKIEKTIHEQGGQFFKFKDQVIFASEILKDDGSPYQVYTPYKKKWLKQLSKSDIREFKPNLKSLIAKSKLKEFKPLPSLKELGFSEVDIDIECGQRAARKMLKSFADKMKDYHKDRDFPSQSGTSRLSVHFRFGTISIREAVRACLSKRSEGAKTWLSELIWRDFYFMILDQFPHVERGAFKKQYDKIKWPGKSAHFKAWCEGQTGFPIVDAAMRQLNETGYMHNRLRMIAASFLVKDLLVNWQKGEAYFAEKLLDFDLAANNGGWQWSASTGCDAQPYFRIFNPDSQTKKFDPKGEFINKWVPEYNDPNKTYPEPIVDHSEQRKKAVLLFKRSAE